MPALADMWFSSAGSPEHIYSDPAGEVCSDQWTACRQGLTVNPTLLTEAWQDVRVERHGALIKDMLDRYDTEKPIRTPHEFDVVPRACFQAKNALSRHEAGYAPEQIALGKSARVPASPTSDETAGSHSLAVGESLESGKFRRHSEIRSLARATSLTSNKDQAIRRALLRRSCPTRGPFQAGQ
jgi:hypothetical protein